MNTRVLGALVAAAVLCGGILYSQMLRSQTGVDMNMQVLAALQTLPDYNIHSSHYLAWFNENEQTAFGTHFKEERRGGRRGRTVTSFDENAYLDQLFQGMAQSAVDAGYPKSAENLKALRKQLGEQKP